jgi:SulP family sulfate permease
VINIRTGGLTRISGMLHSVLLLAVVISLAPLAKLIPHAALAGILIKVGYDIIDVAYLKRAHRGPRLDLALMALVLLLTVFVDLITAVAAGVVLAALAFVKQLADEQLDKFASEDDSAVSVTPEEKTLLDAAGRAITIFQFGGPLSFGAAADLGHHVRERTRKKAAALVLDFSGVPFMDVSAARAVETIICDAKQAGKTVFISGLDDEVAETLAALDATHCLPADTAYEKRIDALRAAVEFVKQQRINGANSGGEATPSAA